MAYGLDERVAESKNMSAKYPDRVPVSLLYPSLLNTIENGKCMPVFLAFA